MSKPLTSEVWNAFDEIVKNAEEPALNWAVNYAREGIGMEGEVLRVQCLYVLNNMTRWRGETAKRVRETLKGYAKK